MIKFEVEENKIKFNFGVESLAFKIDDFKQTFSVDDGNEESFTHSEDEVSFAPDLVYSTGTVPVPTYHGAYVVTPKTSQQVLNTAGYKMEDNVTVKKITYAETSNTYGTTAWIGEE